MNLLYDSDFFRAKVYFDTVWTVRATSTSVFAMAGDSGSLVVTDDGRKAIGILFAASNNGRVGFVIPMETVSRALDGVVLVGKHGVD